MAPYRFAISSHIGDKSRNMFVNHISLCLKPSESGSQRLPNFFPSNLDVLFIVTKGKEANYPFNSVFQGLFVDVVLPNSAASRAGIKEGDELLMVNDQKVSSWSQDNVSQMLRDIPADQTLKLYMRQFVPLRELIHHWHVSHRPNSPTLDELSIRKAPDRIKDKPIVHEVPVDEYEQLLPVKSGGTSLNCSRSRAKQHPNLVANTDAESTEVALLHAAIQLPTHDHLRDPGEEHFQNSYPERRCTCYPSSSDASYASPCRMINSLSDWAVVKNQKTNVGDIWWSSIFYLIDNFVQMCTSFWWISPRVCKTLLPSCKLNEFEVNEFYTLLSAIHLTVLTNKSTTIIKKRRYFGKFWPVHYPLLPFSWWRFMYTRILIKVIRKGRTRVLFSKHANIASPNHIAFSC